MGHFKDETPVESKLNLINSPLFKNEAKHLKKQTLRKKERKRDKTDSLLREEIEENGGKRKKG